MVGEGVDQFLALVAADRLLVTDRAGSRSVVGEVTGRGPTGAPGARPRSRRTPCRRAGGSSVVPATRGWLPPPTRKLR